MATLTLDQAHALVVEAFQRSGASNDNATSVAKALVAAESSGLKGHGLSRVPSYGAQVKAGKIKGEATPVVTRPKPAIVAIDASNGFAYPALDAALAALPEVARAQGMAAAPIRRSHHCGAAGLPVEHLAEQGFVAMLFANSPPAIAPWGGTVAIYGTNPIAFACPLPGRPPIVVDLALSKVARGNIIAAKQSGETIPEGWALDKNGNPTTDAAAALAGTMLPMGDAKGTALVLMVELLAAGLTGAHFATEASSFQDALGAPPGTGQLILAFDARALGGPAALERFGLLAAQIEAQPGARLPGSRRLELRAKAAAHGLLVADSLINEIKAI